MDKQTVLIVDDDPVILQNYGRMVRHLGYEPILAADPTQALAAMRSSAPAVALVDLKMPQMDGIELANRIKDIDARVQVVVFTAYASIDTAVAAVKAGAFDYVEKPLSPDKLRHLLERVLERRDERAAGETATFHGLIGQSREMREMFTLVRKIAKTDATVLIQGESGTGKELVARAIHAESLRAHNAFVPVDCASLPPGLLESELFGYEKGAFTGAYARKPGILEYASGGTLFLDEIGEMGQDLQAKLFRVLQEKSFRRVGARAETKADIRIVSATNRNLEDQVKEGRFREELFYRLNVVQMNIPPLRDRKEDVLPLAQHLLERYSPVVGAEAVGFSEAARECLRDYSWPGNVRELENAVQRAVYLAEGREIQPDDLPVRVKRAGRTIATADLPLKEARRVWVEEPERIYLLELLQKNQWNITKSANAAGVDRKTFYTLLARHGLARESA